MRQLIFALVVALVAGFACAQESPAYAPGENPFQGEYAFAPGQPVVLHVVVEGIQLEQVTLTPLADVRAGEKVKCAAVVAGNSTSDKKATLTTVLLLEDADSKGLGRVTLDPFKIKNGKAFQEDQRMTVAGEALTGARKVYVFVQIAF